MKTDPLLAAAVKVTDWPKLAEHVPLFGGPEHEMLDAGVGIDPLTVPLPVPAIVTFRV